MAKKTQLENELNNSKNKNPKIPIVDTNVDTSNLAGTNQAQRGNPKTPRNFKDETPKSMADAVDGLTNNAQREQGKTFVPETEKLTDMAAISSLGAYRSQTPEIKEALNSITDESNRKANEVLNTITTTVDNVKKQFANLLGYETGREKLRNEYTAKRQQEKFNTVIEENRQTVDNVTPEEYSLIFDSKGSRIDYSEKVQGLKNEIASINAGIDSETLPQAEISRINELQQELDYYDSLDKKAQAIEELYTYEYLKENGDEESLASYEEMLSHKNDNIFQRAGSALGHLATTTANILPTAIDQMKEVNSNAFAKDTIAEIERLHSIGEVSDEEYKELLMQWKDYIDTNKSTNSDNLSQIIRANADQLSANTYYNAGDVEKFCLQAGESTAQFLLHYAIMGTAATYTMSLVSGTEKMNQLLTEGVDVDTAFMNGLATGLTSFITEKVGMDRFVDMMGTPFSVNALGSILLKQVKSGVSEGLEEVAEGLVEPVIDSVTLGTDYEVNGEELKMEFLLGGTSGLLMAVGGTAIGSVQQSIAINNYLNQRADVRTDVQGRIGNLIVANKYQRNLLAAELEMFRANYDSMTDYQKSVADPIIAKGESALAEFDNNSKVSMAVTFSSDIPPVTTEQENTQAIYQTYTPDFNSEVQFEKKIGEVETQINELLDVQLAVDETNLAAQEILNESGYDIDAKVFNSLDRKQQNDALVALDFAKTMGMNVKVVNNLPQGQNGYVDSQGNIVIDGTKRPVLWTLTHELTHGTEASKFYPQLKELAQNAISDWDNEVNKKIEDYAKGGIELDTLNAEKEVVARFVEDKLGDENFINDVIKYNYSLASKIWQNIKALGSSDETAQIRNAFEKAFEDYRQSEEKASFDNISEYDDLGRKLTPQQQEYFADSKARDADGNLLVLYHGTPLAGFTEFNSNDIFMTTSKIDADSYGGNDIDRNGFNKGRLFEDGMPTEYTGKRASINDVLNNPDAFTLEDLNNAVYALDRNATPEEATRADIIEFLDMEIQENPNIGDIRFETENGYDELLNDRRATYKLYANLVNPYIVDLDGKIASNGENNMYESLDKARKGGYDGFISRNTRIGRYKELGDVVVAFSPDQVKLVSNENPTSSRDIRYSYDSENITPQQADDNILEVGDDEINIKKVTDAKFLEENNVAQILRENPNPKTRGEALERAKKFIQSEIIDHLYAVEELSRKYRKPSIIEKADFAMTAPYIASQTIADKRYKLRSTEVIGESLNDIMGDLTVDQRYTLSEYLYHMRNIDHLTLQDRMGIENKKGVFGQNIGVDESQQRVNEITGSDPWVIERAERLYEYLKLDRQELVDSGVISEEFAQQLEEMYPHYVPIQRNVDGGSGVDPLDPNKSLKKFKGSTIDILPLEETLIKHTNNVYRTALNNAVHNEIIDTVGKFENAEIEDVIDAMDNGFNPLGVDTKGAKRMYAYKDGKKVSIPVSDELYKALSPAKNPFGLKDVKTIKTISEFRRNLITGWNPIFMVTNGIKDVQDALFNSKYPKQFLGSYVEAWAQIANKGEFYQLYIRNGGGQNSYIKELSDAKLKGKSRFTNAWNTLVGLNEAVEQAPRLAEFISTLKNGGNIEKAMYNAAEVTTNFKRGGDTAKYLNRNGFAFLNASIQGFNKQVRNIKDAKDGGIKGMLTYMAKATLMGVPLLLMNHLMWKDDDDYEELSDYVKANYYCVMKYGDGKFIRIPKGRIAAFFQTVLQNGGDTVTGQKKLWEALIDDYVSFMDNIAPNNPAENFILTPISQAFKNKTWYGGDLVPARLQDVPDSEQYDETTDALSIAIGKLSKEVADKTGMDFLELSPYKINYVLDQYSGALGDIILPALTQETTVGVDNPFIKGSVAAFLDKFTTDSVLKNENVTKFYSLRDEVTKLANSVYATDEQTLAKKYLYSVSSEMGRLYAEMHSIQADPNLSNKDKFNQARELKKQINDLARTALANYDQIDIEGDYANIGGVQYYKAGDDWKKPTSTQLEKVSGLDEKDTDAFFQTFGAISSARSEIKANTPEGQTADYTQATIDAINNSNMSYSGKNALYDSYYDSKFTQYVNGMDLSDEQKYNLKLANKMAVSEKDENGKTIANSKARATAQAYEELGLLQDVLKYIEDNDISPTVMGLSKTVYKELTGKTTGSSSTKSSTKSSYSSAYKKSIGNAGRTPTIKASAAKVQKTTTADAPQSGNASSFLRAYSNSLGSRQVSSSRSMVVCPNCGNRVTPYNGRCPICGNNL